MNLSRKKSALFVCLLCASVAFSQTAGGVRKKIVDTAMEFRGVPYVYGSESPKAFDCSGFVRYVFRKAADITLPRTSKAQWSAGVPIALAKAQPGDVLVFDTVGGAPSHVAILLDQKTLIHAVSEGPKTGVIVSPLSDRYFAPRLMGARVFVPEAMKAPAESTEVPRRPSPTSTVPAAPTPAARAPGSREELPISIVGFTITNEPVIYRDKIPAAVGSAIQYAVSNGTGKDGVFEILFYKMDLDPSKAQTLRRDRVSIPSGGMCEVAAFTFTEPGQYKLILKTHDNLKRVERIWKVVDVR